MKRFTISLNDETFFTITKFDKGKLDNALQAVINSSKSGDTIEYWKSCKKWAYESMLVLKNKYGTIYQEVIRGDRALYLGTKYKIN